MKNLHEIKEFINTNTDPKLLAYFQKKQGPKYQYSQTSIYDKVAVYNNNIF